VDEGWVAESGGGRGYHRAVPLYEFRCDRCGGRFEELVAAGTESIACRTCGGVETRRVYSTPGAPFKIVKTPGETRKQERSNAKLRQDTKRRFKAARRRARQAQRGEG
jgi:putative FmdB family regulatory protein